MKKLIFGLVCMLFCSFVNALEPTSWESVDSLPSVSGSYILNQDVLLTANWVVDSEISLDLNGHDIITTASINVTGGGKLVITDSLETGTITTSKDPLFYVFDGQLDLQAGSFYSSAEWGDLIRMRGSHDSTATNYSVATVGPKATLSFINNGYGYGIPIYQNTSTINKTISYGVVVNLYGKINSGLSNDEKTDAYGGTVIYVNGSVKATTGNVPIINIYEGAVLNNEYPSSYNPDGVVYAAGYAKWNITGGTFIGGDSLSIKSGEFNISGGLFTSNGKFYDPAIANGNGSENTGSAISITSNSAYAQKIDINISGGTFISNNGYGLYEGIAYKSETDSYAADNTYVKTLNITGGNFKGKKGAVLISNFNDIATKKVTNGFFNSNVSQYVTDNMTVVSSNDANYPYQITTKENIKVVGNQEVVWSPTNKSDLIVTFNGLYENFAKVLVDGEVVDPTNYTVESGSTIITFKQAYLETLKAGNHTITVVYNDSEASVQFTVGEVNPETGDNMSLYLTIGVISIVGLAIVFKKKVFN